MGLAWPGFSKQGTDRPLKCSLGSNCTAKFNRAPQGQTKALEAESSRLPCHIQPWGLPPQGLCTCCPHKQKHPAPDAHTPWLLFWGYPLRGPNLTALVMYAPTLSLSTTSLLTQHYPASGLGD